MRTEVWDRDKAIAHYKKTKEPYKVELVEAIPEGEPIRMYWHGDWQDLCRGPHLAHTGQCPADSFKLTHVAGAYWRGDSRNKMLQRIYGTAWRTKAELKPSTCTGWRRPPSATTARSAGRWSSSTCRKRRRAWCSGIRTAGRSIARWKTTCAAA